jgi:NAD(P)H-hydrate epimerase
MKIVTSSEMADIEERFADCGVSINVLMVNAGQMVASEIESDFGPIFGAKVLALIGPGNNGSDGLVACTKLAKQGAKVTAAILANRPELDDRLQQAIFSNVEVLEVSESSKGATVLGEIAASSHVVIDAVLGTGASRPLLNPISMYLKTVEKSVKDSTFIVAVDLPSGVNANTGSVDESVLVPQMTNF